jgi:hypothetical protein
VLRLNSLCRKGEIYTQGHGIPPCISEWDLHGALATSSLCLGNIHPGTWHSSMYISEWDLHGAATSYYQQLVPQGRYIHRDMFLHVYIRMGSTRCCALATTSSLCHKGRNIHPGTWHSSMYISEWIYGAALLLPAACAQGEIYTQGHGIPPCIYQ